jgi:hypothetical protein
LEDAEAARAERANHVRRGTLGGLLVTVVGRLIVREWNARLYLELVAEAVTVDVAAGRRPPGRARAARPVLTDGPAPRPYKFVRWVKDDPRRPRPPLAPLSATGR